MKSENNTTTVLQEEDRYLEHKEYYNNFVPPEWFKRPKLFSLPRKKSVIVKKDDRREAVTKQGIVLVDIASAPSSIVPIGRVYSVGPEVDWLKPGMRVTYNQYSNLTTTIDGVQYLILYDMDVFTVEPEEASISTEKKAVEKRAEISHEDMPDVAPSKEEIKMQREEAREVAELIKKDVTTKHIAVDGLKKD